MRLNWFSPLPPARTDIAHFTGRVLPALAGHADVTLWTAQPTWDAGLEEYARVQHFQPDHLPWARLNAADVTIYNIGNDARYHVEICQVARRHSGIPILHDVRLHELFAYLFRWVDGDRDGYVRAMGRTYGAAGRRDALRFWHDQLDIAAMAARYPLASVALRGAAGAIVHTMEALGVVRGEGTCPILCPPLPYPARDAPSVERPASPPYRLVIFGYLHHNRRLDAVLHALAGLDPAERAQFTLAIFGEIWDEEHIRRLISVLQLGDVVTIRGFVPEDELDEALAGAHLAINLRYPSMGEASGSQLRIWDHALPSLVTAAGMYARLPEDAVAFVRPDAEIPDIQHHLRALLANPLRFRRVGAAGRRQLAERHSPETYAQAVVEFASTVRRRGAQPIAFRLGERTADAMRLWLEPRAADSACRRVARELHAMTASPVAGSLRMAATDRFAAAAHAPEATGHRVGRAVAPLPATAMRAAIDVVSAPHDMYPGSRALVRARVRNCSDAVWPALGQEDGRLQINLGNRWADRFGRRIIENDARAALPHDLAPSEEAIIRLIVQAPDEPGEYHLELDLVQEDVSWFEFHGSSLARCPIVVSTALLPADAGDMVSA